MTERHIGDAEVLDRIAERYRLLGEEGVFDDASSTIENVGDTVELTGRDVWREGESL